MDVWTYQQVDDCGHIQWEETVAEEADRLEKADCTAKELAVDGDDSTSKPNDAEYDFEE